MTELKFKGRRIVHILLLGEISLVVFFSGLLPPTWIGNTVSFLYICIYLTSAFIASRWQRTLLPIAVFLVTMRIIASFAGLDEFVWWLSLMNFFFFLAIVILLISQIAKSSEVSAKVIIEAVNGYLLSGIVFASLTNLIMKYSPEAYSFRLEHEAQIIDVIYYSFVTLTTLGYGDIVPVAPYAKSLAVLNAVFGQIYLTVIIALLVGKFANRSLQ